MLLNLSSVVVLGSNYNTTVMFPGPARETDQAAVCSRWTDSSERGESEGAAEEKKRNGGKEEERGGRGCKVKKEPLFTHLTHA